MQEGTFEELIDDIGDEGDGVIEKRAAGNGTASERAKRQAEIPDDPEQDNTKFVIQCLIEQILTDILLPQGGCVRV